MEYVIQCTKYGSTTHDYVGKYIVDPNRGGPYTSFEFQPEIEKATRFPNVVAAVARIAKRDEPKDRYQFALVPVEATVPTPPPVSVRRLT
jgi:hypothetical protein